MLRAPVSSVRTAALIGILAFAASARAQDAAGAGVVGEVRLPGGLPAALAAIGDPLPADRGQFLLDVIRGAYNTSAPRKGPGSARLQALLTQIDRAARDPAASTRSDALPLPLAVPIWTNVVFGHRVQPEDLLSAILGSPDASRLYCGLLSLDEATRAWLASEPELIAEVAARQSAAFLLAAPGLRVADGVVRVPGGRAAVPVWEALVGRGVHEPAAFTRSLLAARDGRVANFFGAVSALTSPQIDFLFGLDSPDVSRRIDAGRRVSAVFESLFERWDSLEWTSWRPSIDPLVLVADLREDDRGRPMLPGTRPFWNAVFASKAHVRSGADAGALAEGDPADFPWLCERIFGDDVSDRRAFYQSVMFASWRIPQVTPANALDAVEVVRAAGRLPALVASLERAGLGDMPALASAARRAARLSAIGNEAVAARALTQFQGTLVLLTRAALRGSLPRSELPRLVSSLSAIDVDGRGEYKGAVARWIATNLPRDLLPWLAGAPSPRPLFVDWEGTRYRVDFAAAESARLTRLLGEGEPDLSSARTDGALARDLLDVAYALAIGQPDSLPSGVSDVAARHDFGLRGGGPLAPWLVPVVGEGADSGFHVRGSLLGLDSAVAPLSLVRVSSIPPARPPSLGVADRRVLMEAVALVDPLSLTDADRDAIVEAMRRGRARLAAARGAAEAYALADEIRIAPARRTLLAWVVMHDPQRAGSFLSPSELLWAGRRGPLPAGFQAWGAPADPRLACLCVQLLDRRPLEAFNGRWSTGMLASGFPELNLRLTELLAELRMPASLLGPVLAAATADLVDGAVSRDRDDRRGLLEYVLALDRDRVEQYLATLTTDGPLVPVTGTGTRAWAVGAPR